MATWREIDRVRKDPDGFRAIAARLLKLPDHGMTSWEVDFLESISLDRGKDEYSTRQSEKLLQIRDDAESITTYRGFSVKKLIQDCYEARLDLEESDEQWIEQLKGRIEVKRRHIGRLLKCARALGNIEKDAA